MNRDFHSAPLSLNSLLVETGKRLLPLAHRYRTLCQNSREKYGTIGCGFMPKNQLVFQASASLEIEWMELIHKAAQQLCAKLRDVTF
jgi:hypothetical protein